MKNLIIAALIAAATPAMAQTNINISIGDPGFYGRINSLDFGPPQLVYERPVIIERTRYVREPIYLRVPPGHRKNWRKHCARYNACGQQVYFVRDEWYSNTYAPRYRETHRSVRQVSHDGNRGGYAERPARHEERHESKHERKHDKHEGKHGGGNGNKHGDKHGNKHGRD